MASSFPTAKDVLENPGVGAKLNTTPHKLQHSKANDAIEALQDKVGIDDSTDETTLDYKVRVVGTAVNALGVTVAGYTATIATHTSQIATNTSDIATANGTIATHTSQISTANSNIATNTSNIATNTADILVVKNRIHLPNPFRNSSGAIWQRGTTYTPAAGAFAADGYINYYRSDIVWSRQVSGDTQGSGYCIRIQRPNGNSTTTATGIAQSCLSADSVRFAGLQCTFSMRVRKGSTAASNILSAASAYTGTGTDQSVGSGFTGSASTAITIPSITTSWQTISCTFTAGASVSQVAMFATLAWAGTAGASDYFEFKDVRLDVGPTALVHAPLPYAIDLAECQFLLRHYSAANSAYLMLPIAWRECAAIYAGNAIVGLLDTPMRAAPTATKVGAWTVTDGHSGNALSTLSAAPVVSQSADGQGLFMYCYTGSALTSKQMYFVQANNDTTARMIFSAEI